MEYYIKGVNTETELRMLSLTLGLKSVGKSWVGGGVNETDGLVGL